MIQSQTPNYENIINGQKLNNNVYQISKEYNSQQQSSNLPEDLYDLFDIESMDCLPKYENVESFSTEQSYQNSDMLQDCQQVKKEDICPLQNQQEQQYTYNQQYKLQYQQQQNQYQLQHYSQSQQNQQESQQRSEYNNVDIYTQNQSIPEHEDIFVERIQQQNRKSKFSCEFQQEFPYTKNNTYNQQIHALKNNIKEEYSSNVSDNIDDISNNNYNSYHPQSQFNQFQCNRKNSNQQSFNSKQTNNRVVLLKHKIKKQKQININEIDVKSLYTRKKNIYKQNIKPQTTHICTNFMNIIVPYLIEFYLDNFKCRGSQQSNFFSTSCECGICVEYQELRKLKMNTKSQNISKLRNLWAYPRIKHITEDFILKKAYYAVINKKSYRSIAAQTSILLCLPSLQKGIQKPEVFFKII